MTRRDRLMLLGLALLVAAMAILPAVGVHSDVLLAAPALALVLPLLAGRYISEEHLARLAAAFAPPPAGRRPRWHPRPHVRRRRSRAAAG